MTIKLVLGYRFYKKLKVINACPFVDLPDAFRRFKSITNKEKPAVRAIPAKVGIYDIPLLH